MKKLFVSILILMISASVSTAGNDKTVDKPATSVNKASTCSISGSVEDAISREKLVCARIEIPDTGISVFTDILGNFEIPDLTPGTYNLKVTYISYNEKEVTDLVVSESKTLTIPLQPL